MKWEKLGRIYEPQRLEGWMHSHAANPSPIVIDDNTVGVYFNTRDASKRSYVAYLELKMHPEPHVSTVYREPVLSPGEIGLYDDSGVSIGCAVNIHGRLCIYYIGWNLAVTVPWHNSIGVAVHDAVTGKFQKYGRAPLLDRCEVDPYSISYPFVFPDDGLFRMYYGSNLAWGEQQEDMKHVIKYAESEDGFSWRRDGLIAINHKTNDEYAISRPFVIKENAVYHMWYAFRGARYRIGYAQSRDGIDWNRKDEEVGITVSDDGWDSEMVCYPAIFDLQGERYMLYNGNGYGLTGIGLARLVR